MSKFSTSCNIVAMLFKDKDMLCFNNIFNISIIFIKFETYKCDLFHIVGLDDFINL